MGAVSWCLGTRELAGIYEDFTVVELRNGWKRHTKDQEVNLECKKKLIRHTINWKCVLCSSSILMYLKHCCPEPCQNLMLLVLLREDNWAPPEADLNTKTQVHMADLRIALRKHHIEKHKSKTRQRRQPILGAISSQLSLQATGIHFLALPTYHIREQCRPQRPEKARKCMFQQAEAKLECNEVARRRDYRKNSY